MTENCPCDEPTTPHLDIPAGLDALTRQLRAFPEVRDALLRAVPSRPALAQWRPGGERDLGMMWLEMWAYVSDVLGFYDERIANESYIRTARRRPSLRRIVDLLGYVASPGVAGSATLAALADGRTLTRLPPGTAFRSDGFGDNAPQTFELRSRTTIHPFKNEWQIGPLRRGTLPQPTPSMGPGQRGEGAAHGTFWVFETAGFNLTKDRFAVFEFRNRQGKVVDRDLTKVVAITPFTGKDGQPYMEVEVSPRITIPARTVAGRVRVLTPTVSAGIAKDGNRVRIDDDTVVFDAIYRQIRDEHLAIYANEAERRYRLLRAAAVTDAKMAVGDDITVPVTRVRFKQRFPRSSRSVRGQISFHFTFVEAGTVTTVAEADLTADDLSRDAGVPILGLVELPPDADEDGIEQQCLLVDADQKGALVQAQIRFDGRGRATFRVSDATDLADESYKAPITIYGNLIETTRGETVTNEVLGNGDAQQKNQRFILRKKPLTYVRSRRNQSLIESTLSIRVDGVAWKEVKTFYGVGPEEFVYIVRHDDDLNAMVVFGDGVRGARLTTGTGNVTASYRFGSGFAAPPAQAIQQLSRPVPGLRGVRSPIAARAGLDPDGDDTLRVAAPRSVQTLRRAVAAVDFEVLSLLSQGVVQAKAEYLWLEDEQRAGVLVTYIGEIGEDELKGDLAELAEENLPIQVNKAEGRRSTLVVDLVVDDRFNGGTVARNVEAALTHPTQGVLSPVKAEIGGRLWVSQIHRAIHDVDGVVGVQNMVLRTKAMSRATVRDALLEGQALSRRELRRAQITLGRNREYRLSKGDVLCTPSATYFDFGEGGRRVQVRARSRAAIVRDTPRRREEI
jgi:hypothetical protein